MKKIFIICLLTLASLQTQAQDTIQKSLHQLGINLGAATGIGLSYRYTPGKFMHQVTFLPVATDDIVFIDLAYSLHYTLKDRKFANFNLYGGTHFIYNSESGLNNITGGGFGFDFKCSNHFTVNLNAGYGAYFLDERTSLYPTGELGIFYKL